MGTFEDLIYTLDPLSKKHEAYLYTFQKFTRLISTFIRQGGEKPV